MLLGLSYCGKSAHEFVSNWGIQVINDRQTLKFTNVIPLCGYLINLLLNFFN